MEKAERLPPAAPLTVCNKAPGAACCCCCCCWPAPGPDPAAPKSNSCLGRLTGTSGNSGPFRFACSIMAAITLLRGARHPRRQLPAPRDWLRLQTSCREKPIGFQYSLRQRPLDTPRRLVHFSLTSREFRAKIGESELSPAPGRAVSCGAAGRGKRAPWVWRLEGCCSAVQVSTGCLEDE